MRGDTETLLLSSIRFRSALALAPPRTPLTLRAQPQQQPPVAAADDIIARLLSKYAEKKPTPAGQRGPLLPGMRPLSALLPSAPAASLTASPAPSTPGMPTGSLCSGPARRTPAGIVQGAASAASAAREPDCVDRILAELPEGPLPMRPPGQPGPSRGRKVVRTMSTERLRSAGIARSGVSVFSKQLASVLDKGLVGWAGGKAAVAPADSAAAAAASKLGELGSALPTQPSSRPAAPSPARAAPRSEVAVRPKTPPRQQLCVVESLEGRDSRGGAHWPHSAIAPGAPRALRDRHPSSHSSHGALVAPTAPEEPRQPASVSAALAAACATPATRITAALASERQARSGPGSYRSSF